MGTRILNNSLVKIDKELLEEAERLTYTIMWRHSPQEQLFAGGCLYQLVMICDREGIALRQHLYKNIVTRKALDFIAEMKHWDCEALKERNKTLAS